MVKKLITTAAGVGLVFAMVAPAFVANICNNQTTGPSSINICTRTLTKTKTLTLNNTGSVIHIYQKGLSNFFKEKSINLFKANGQEQLSFDITLTMREDAGDEFQDKTTSFDLVIGIETSSATNIPTIPPFPTFKIMPTIARFPTLP